MFRKDLHFSSKKHDWETPQFLFNKLNEEFHFDLDACASVNNTKCVNFFTIEDNCLVHDWQKYKSVFINPPYDSKFQDKILEKSVSKSRSSTKIVLLIPARTDTKRWHEWIFPYASDIRFLRGRLKFETQGVTHENSAPFPSAVVIFS